MGRVPPPQSSGSAAAGAAPGHEPAGVLDRQAFDARLADAWAQARGSGQALSLLLIDIDHFRAYVDTHRAALGQERLHRIAGTLTGAVFRPTDLVGRWGDDEFAILLPGVHEGGARVVAARVRSLVNALALPHRGGVGGIVTVSIGLAAFTPDSDAGPQVLVALCMQALAQAKRLGRDSIVSQDWLA